MVANQKVTRRAVSMPAGIGIGVIVCLLITVLMAGVLAWMMLKEWVKEDSLGYGVAAVLAVSAFTGAFIAAVRIKHRRMFVCMLVGLAYFAMLLMSTALFFGGQYQGVGVTAIVILCASAAAGLLGIQGGGRGKNGRRKHRSR